MLRTRGSIRSVIAGIFVLASLLVGTAGAQQPPAGGDQGRGGAPAPPQNLQVLPKDIPTAQLITMMRGFAAGLGVQCVYCHVDQPTRDFASDVKPPKKTARLMMQMVMHDNEMIATGIGKPAAEITKVQCVTCHRGEAIPKNPPPPPPPAAAAPAAQPPRH